MIPASNLLIIAAGIVAVAAVLIFLNAVLAARWAQRAAYYSVRRDAQKSANRRLSLSIAAVVLAVSFFGISLVAPREAAQSPPSSPTPAPTAVAANATTVRPSPTSAPTFTAAPPTPLSSPLILSSAVQQPAPTAIVKATQIPEPTSSLMSPLPTPESSPLTPPTQAPPNKRLVLSTIASGVDANGAPVDAGTTFTTGVKAIHVFFEFRDVPPSALLRHSWFRNGGSVFFRSKRLTKNGQGIDSVSWSPSGGFKAGLYEVRVVLGGVPQFVANFEVK